VAIAEGFGVPAKRVVDVRDLAAQLRSAHAHEGPFLLEIPVSA
jgi:thiamine pyrophosphate-dependent acetolactate synthase large subunit-like protein